jgi:hypothetical protein
MGGTFGSSKRMLERFGKDVELTTSTRGPFEVTTGMNGQVWFAIHTNPRRRSCTRCSSSATACSKR